MKSTLVTVLIVLVIVCLVRMDSPLLQKQVNAANPPTEGNEDPLFEAMERFLEIQPAREPRPERELPGRGREPEMIGLLPEDPHPAEHRREQERHREVQREREHHLQQQKHRIENMHVAARHLEEAGMKDLAHQIHREAKEQEHRLREEAERAMHHAHQPQPHQEIHELLHQLRNEVRELKQEVRELREVVAEKRRHPEIEAEQKRR